MKDVFFSKCIFFIMIAVLAAGFSCKKEAKKTADEDAPVHLVMWHEAEESVAAVLRDELKKLEPAIVVEVVRKENSTGALKLAAGDPRTAPDLYFGPHDKIGLFALIGLLEPVDQVLSPDEWDRFISMTTEAGTFQGKKYQMPIFFETLLLIYNKKLLDVPPSTTDELLAMMKEKTKDGMFGYVEQHSTAYFMAAWLHPFGGYIINENSEPGLNHPGTVEAVTYHKQFVEYMPADGEWNTVITLFNEGKAGATLNGPWIIGSAREQGISLGFAPPPMVTPAGKPMSPYAGVQGVVMISTTEHKEAVYKVLRLLAEKNAGEKMALAVGSAPAHKDAYNNPEVAGDELIRVMREAGEQAVPMPNVPEMDVMWSTSENAFVAINKNNADIIKTLEKEQKNALQSIADMK